MAAPTVSNLTNPADGAVLPRGVPIQFQWTQSSIPVGGPPPPTITATWRAGDGGGALPPTISATWHAGPNTQPPTITATWRGA